MSWFDAMDRTPALLNPHRLEALAAALVGYRVAFVASWAVSLLNYFLLNFPIGTSKPGRIGPEEITETFALFFFGFALVVAVTFILSLGPSKNFAFAVGQAPVFGLVLATIIALLGGYVFGPLGVVVLQGVALVELRKYKVRSRWLIADPSSLAERLRYLEAQLPPIISTLP